MKGPGIRIDNEVRRVWHCPVCGQSQPVSLEITRAWCGCRRDGVPMKLAEGLRPDRKLLRPEVRAILDRIQAGEQFPRLSSPGSSDSNSSRGEGGGGHGWSESGGNRRPPRRDRSDGPPREPPASEIPNPTPCVAESAPQETTPIVVQQPSVVVAVPPTPIPDVVADDAFGAGIEVAD